MCDYTSDGGFTKKTDSGQPKLTGADMRREAYAYILTMAS